ncbi:SagB/ThcOx family dehydrogenase [bacterium]|nr:SagB/ThcOx family dehydrogenase [bacterium]
MKECISGELGLTDQTKGLPIPPPQKEVAPGAPLIDLPDPATLKLVNPDIFYCIRERESRRKYTDEPLSLEELSYLLYTTQGVKKVFRQGQMTLRTVPSGGARHPFETYLAVNNVTSLTPGLYRYQPIEHKLTFLFTPEHMVEKLNEGALGQIFVGRSPVVFIWSVLPYRGEWRYSISAHKIMLLDAGHLCQNLYLACESLGLGTCAIGAYSQTLMDELLKLDGHDEFVIYLSPVGKLK